MFLPDLQHISSAVRASNFPFSPTGIYPERFTVPLHCNHIPPSCSSHAPCFLHYSSCLQHQIHRPDSNCQNPSLRTYFLCYHTDMTFRILLFSHTVTDFWHYTYNTCAFLILFQNLFFLLCFQMRHMYMYEVAVGLFRHTPVLIIGIVFCVAKRVCHGRKTARWVPSAKPLIIFPLPTYP